MPTMKQRRTALRIGFHAALKTQYGWTFYETVEDASEGAEALRIKRPKIIDLDIWKRVLA